MEREEQQTIEQEQQAASEVVSDQADGAGSEPAAEEQKTDTE